MGLHTSLGPEVACLLLEEGDSIRGWLEDRVASFQFGGVENLIEQVVPVGALLAALEELGAWRPDHEPARERHQILASLPLQPLPQLVGPKDQRYVGGVLGVCQADDPGLAVAGPLIVRRCIPLQPEHALSASGEVESSRAPHPAET